MSASWQLSGYTPVRRLGAGASGSVVLATHDDTGTPVAIKYLIKSVGEDPSFRTAFRAEARLLAEIDDPHVSRLYEYVESPDGAAIVMELVNGVSLRQMLRAHGPTTPGVGALRPQGLAGRARRRARPGRRAPRLQAGERAGHRRGRRASSPTSASPCRSGEGSGTTVTGTPRYMAPEQWTGAPASPACDIYAATATFFECLTGHPPVRRAGPAHPAPAARHRADPAPTRPPRRCTSCCATAWPSSPPTGRSPPRSSSRCWSGWPPGRTARSGRSADCASWPAGRPCSPRSGRSRTAPAAPPAWPAPSLGEATVGVRRSAFRQGRRRTALVAGGAGRGAAGRWRRLQLRLAQRARRRGRPDRPGPPRPDRHRRRRPGPRGRRRAPRRPRRPPRRPPPPRPRPPCRAGHGPPTDPFPGTHDSPGATGRRPAPPPPPPDVTAPSVGRRQRQPDGSSNPRAARTGTRPARSPPPSPTTAPAAAALRVSFRYTVDGSHRQVRMSPSGAACSGARSGRCPRRGSSPPHPDPRHRRRRRRQLDQLGVTGVCDALQLLQPRLVRCPRKLAGLVGSPEVSYGWCWVRFVPRRRDPAAPRVVYRTARVGLRVTPGQRRRCFGLLRSAGDVWACVLEVNAWRRRRRTTRRGRLPGVVSGAGGVGAGHVRGFGHYRVPGRCCAGSPMRGSRRRNAAAAGDVSARFPRRRRGLLPVRWYHGTFTIDGRRVRIPTAAGHVPRCGCAWTGRCRTRCGRSGRSPWCARVAGCSSTSPPRCRSRPTRPVRDRIRAGWPGWIWGSSTPTPSPAPTGRRCWCPGGRSAPNTVCTWRTRRPAAVPWPAGHPGRGRRGRGGGGSTAVGPARSRAGTGAGSVRPSTRPPAP